MPPSPFPNPCFKLPFFHGWLCLTILCGCDKIPQPWSLEWLEIDSLTFPETENMILRCWNLGVWATTHLVKCLPPTQEDPSSIPINYILKSRVGYSDGEYVWLQLWWRQGDPWGPLASSITNLASNKSVAFFLKNGSQCLRNNPRLGLLAYSHTCTCKHTCMCARAGREHLASIKGLLTLP